MQSSSSSVIKRKGKKESASNLINIEVMRLQGPDYDQTHAIQWISFVLRKTLFDFIKSRGSRIRLKFSEVALLGLLYSPK